MNTQPDHAQFDTQVLETEQALIGTCLSEPSAYAAVIGQVEPDQFFEPIHCTVWEAMSDLLAQGSVVNMLTVCTKLGNGFVSEGMKLSVYLARCCSNTYCPPAYAVEFSKRVRAAWAMRQIVLASETAKSATAVPGTDAGFVISELMQGLDETRVRMDPRRYGFHSAAQVTVEVIERMAAAYAGTPKSGAVSTGLADLDSKLMGGFRAGDLVIMAGRPGMGKSLSAVSMARQSALAGHAVGFYSLEMGREQIGARFISDHAFRHDKALSSGQILHGKITEREAEDTMESAKDFARLSIEIDDSSSMTVGEITARTRSLAEKFARKGKKLDAIIIDYLKMVRASDRYRGQRHYEVGEISSGLKSLAKDLGIAVVLLAQLNRNVESRDDKRPQLSDLRESGDLESDADVVIFLYREAYYLQSREPAPGTEEHGKWQSDMSRCHNKLEMIIAKQRMGPTGAVEVFCHPGASALRDLGREFARQEEFR